MWLKNLIIAANEQSSRPPSPPPQMRMNVSLPSFVSSDGAAVSEVAQTVCITTSKKFKLEIFPSKDLLQELHFIWVAPSPQQGKHLITKYLFFLLLSCGWPSYPWKMEDPSHCFAWEGIQTSFCLSVSASLLYMGSLTLTCTWGFCRDKIKLDFFFSY